MQDVAAAAKPNKDLPGLRAWEIRRHNLRKSLWVRAVAIGIGALCLTAPWLPLSVWNSARGAIGQDWTPAPPPSAQTVDTLEQVLAKRQGERLLATGSATTTAATSPAAMAAPPPPTVEPARVEVEAPARKPPAPKPTPVAAPAPAAAQPSAWVQDTLSRYPSER